MSKNIYEYCPNIENDNYLLRLVIKEDLEGLHQVYSDKEAVPYFNSDNCNGDIFYYETIERMESAIKFWIDSYTWKYFVRFTIIDKLTNIILGTIEAFHRDSTDSYNNVCVIRLDLRSDYEKEKVINELFLLIEEPFYDLFYAEALITKIQPFANERKKALKSIGYKESFDPSIGPDGTKYYHYYFKYKK